MIILIAGMPRSGSMWSYNVTRAIVEENNKNILPKGIIIDQKKAIDDALQSNVNPSEVYVIKTHYILSDQVQTNHDLKVICNYRDVRDALLSYMRFTHSDFQKSFESMQSMMYTTDYYFEKFSSRLLKINYNEMMKDPIKIVGNMSKFLGMPASETCKARIVEKYSKNNVKKLIKELEKVNVDGHGNIVNGSYRGKYLASPNSDGTFRILDPETNFQTNHITSSQDGEWKNVFTDEQKNAVQKIADDWLKRHNFKD